MTIDFLNLAVYASCDSSSGLLLIFVGYFSFQLKNSENRFSKLLTRCENKLKNGRKIPKSIFKIENVGTSEKQRHSVYFESVIKIIFYIYRISFHKFFI